MTPLLKRPDQFEAFRIKDGDSNRLVIMFDSTPERKLGFIACVEIFDVVGCTPPNSHRDADELFFIIEGKGRARILGEWRDINKGDALVVTAGDMHELENLGNDRLYTLTVMVPDEEFSQLIRGGVHDQLDDEDLRVLQGIAL